MTEQFEKNDYKKRMHHTMLLSFIGIALLIAAYELLFWNEGKVYNASVVEKAIPISAVDAAAENSVENRLVAVSGFISTDELTGDLFEVDGATIRLFPQNVVALYREVEMYVWVDEKEEFPKEDRYKTKWLSLNKIEEMENSSTTADYQNPETDLTNSVFFPTTTQIGTYSVTLAGAVETADFSRLNLKEADFEIKNNNNKTIQVVGTDYIFVGKGTVAAPKVGDVRIKYSFIPSGQNVTMFGSLEDGKIIEYKNKHEQQFYRLFMGTREEALEYFSLETISNSWVWRMVSFLFLWAGFILVIHLFVKQKIVSFLTEINLAEIVGIAFVKALALTVLLSFLFSRFHSLFLFLIVVFLTSFTILYFLVPIHDKKNS